MIVYGSITGACTFLIFVIIVYGLGKGDLGFDCNREYNDSCDRVFRARVTAFAELTWLVLVSAWELKILRRGIFDLLVALFFKTIYSNLCHFCSVVIGAISVFLVVFIPGLNTKAFKHKGVRDLSSSAIVIFTVFVEI